MANRMSSLGVIGIALGIIIVGAIFVAMYVRATYNDLVGMQEQAKTAWAQVENQLQRRNDLIPNYVETVKGYAKQETTIFTAIADARARMAGARNPAETIAANNQLESALARLLVVVENYPVLKSSENFMRLQDELAGTENRIATERMRYNETVRVYNTHIKSFPANLIAGFFGFKEKDYFEAEAGAKEVPKVKF